MSKRFYIVLGATVLALSSPAYAQNAAPAPVVAPAQSAAVVTPPAPDTAAPAPAVATTGTPSIPVIASPTGDTTRPDASSLVAPSGNNDPNAKVPPLGSEIFKAVQRNDAQAPQAQVGGDGLVPADIPGLSLADEQQLLENAQREEMRKLRGEAYEAMMSGMLPMEPPQLRDAFERIDKNQKAIEEPLAYPKPEVAFTTLSLDPGVKPLTFKLATGHVTTVSFLDVTGQPWPIKDLTWAGNFEIKSSAASADQKFPMYPNLMQIIPLSEYAYGNMSVRLLGLATPITFTLRTGRDAVQYRLDLRVPENGPFALPSLIDNGGNSLKAGDPVLTRIMEGVPPASAAKLKVDGADGRTTAYSMEGMVYLRTPLTLLSPAWSASVKSADGMNVYAMTSAPVVLLSDQGQMVRASLSDSEGGKNE